VGLKTIKLVVTILVSAKANEKRLNNLILLIAIVILNKDETLFGTIITNNFQLEMYL
jgi:hypothetical protein